MLVGVPKEIKPDEYRVGIVPETVAALVARGHGVEIETGAGIAAGLSDEQYRTAGAQIVSDLALIYRRADLVVKVKEPLSTERKMLRPGQLIFAYLHLAPDADQTSDLLASGVTAIAYETIMEADGRLPLLAPMSKVAGRMAAQIAAHFLERPNGGRGILLGSVDGSPPAKFAILGGGTVGCNTASVAIGMGASVTIVVRSDETLKRVTALFGGRACAVQLDSEQTARLCVGSDVVIGAALEPGGAAPKLVSASTVRQMMEGSVMVDVSIDQGGCAETSRPTTHSNPTYLVGGVIHYCVANMPGAVPRTSTFALNNATRPYVLDIADKGFPGAFLQDERLRRGLSVHRGRLTCRAVAEALGLPYCSTEEALALFSS